MNHRSAKDRRGERTIDSKLASLLTLGPSSDDGALAMCILLRRNANGTGRESMRVVDRVMGTEMELGIFL